jgi:chaperonin cofactor prefoldin
METTNHMIIAKLRTQIERTEIRLATYARQYEAFRLLAVETDADERELQRSIAYLYHTSLSILEERKKNLEDYCDDVRDVLASFEDVLDSDRRDELRDNLLVECNEELSGLEDELTQIDQGVVMARRHEHELLAGE